MANPFTAATLKCGRGSASVRRRPFCGTSSPVSNSLNSSAKRTAFRARWHVNAGAEWLEKLGLAAKAGELGGRLSGGMKRRLNIALALVHDPQVIVLDEPEAGLDPQSRVLVRETIRSLARKKTVILTTHNMDEAERVADRVAIIDHGRLVALDTPDALKRTIGEGDVLDIELASSADLEAASALLSKSTLTVSTVNHTLTVRGRGLIDQLGGDVGKLAFSGRETWRRAPARQHIGRCFPVADGKEIARMMQRLWSVFRKSVREQRRDLWVVGLSLAFAPLFVMIYWMMTGASGTTSYGVLVINQDVPVLQADGTTLSAGQDVVDGLRELTYENGGALLRVIEATRPRRRRNSAPQP